MVESRCKFQCLDHILHCHYTLFHHLDIQLLKQIEGNRTEIHYSVNDFTLTLIPMERCIANASSRGWITLSIAIALSSITRTFNYWNNLAVMFDIFLENKKNLHSHWFPWNGGKQMQVPVLGSHSPWPLHSVSRCFCVALPGHSITETN